MRNIFKFLLSIITLYCFGCVINDDEPCKEENWLYDIRNLNHAYDSLFPFDGSQKKIKYLYSNETVSNDTLIFEYYKTDTLEITGNSWSGGGGGCTVYADEVKRYFYRESKYEKILCAEFFDKERIGVKIIDEGESFDVDNVIIDGGIVGKYYFDPSNENRFKTIDINGKKYHHTHFGTGSYFQSHRCVGETYKNCYNARYGLLSVSSTCNNENYTLIVE